MNLHSPEPDEPRLVLALRLAREAGRHVAASLGRADVLWKRPGERVTAADVEAQTRIVQEIAASFPGDGLLAEEGGQATGLDREYVWAVDPLDGTNNLALGIPCFAVSIGLLRRGSPWAGVVHDPNTGFTAWSLGGRGAFAGEQRLRLRGGRLGPASYVCARVPLAPDLAPVVADWLAHHRCRVFGAVALHLAYAALGAIDLVLDHRAALWDLAAGASLLLEAGGLVTDPAGRALFPLDLTAYGGEALPFLAGNPVAHAEAVAAIRASLAGAARGRA